MSTFPALSSSRAAELLQRMVHQRILVVGDAMLDHFIVGRVNRISPEAPVPIVLFEHEEYRAGGAANVALNVRQLGGEVDLVALVGADEPAARLRDLLHIAGAAAGGLITDEKRRTTIKTRVVTSRNQQVARVDYESEDAVAADVEDALVRQLQSRVDGVSAVIVSDYLKGSVTAAVASAAIAAARQRGIPVMVDPKVPHLPRYAGATLVTPNHHEAELATDVRIRSDEDASRAAGLFRARAGSDGVVITRGEHGMWLTWGGCEGQLPAAAREVSDVTGAGDTVVAVLALATAAGATPAEAAQLANEAAGIVVGKFGPSTVSAAELVARFNVENVEFL